MDIDTASASVKDRAIKKLKRDMGPQLLEALNDPSVVEIMLNSDGEVWVDKLSLGMSHLGSLSAANAKAIIDTVAGFHSKEITRHFPLIEGELPIDGSRFAGQLPPVVASPTFAIRKRALHIVTLEEYVEQGIMTQVQYQSLIKAVKTHKNILVIGGTGSGKTTLINAIINQMVVNDPFERVVIIEDTGEIQCAAKNYIQYHTTPTITMTDLLKTTLRMRPDRILVGEVRGPEALDLVDAWNTGHEGGAATLHANNTHSALARLKSLITRHPQAPTDIESLIGEVVHLIVHIERTEDGRHIKGMLEVSGYHDNQYLINPL